MPEKTPTLVILSPGFAGSETESTFMPSQQLLIRSFNRQYPGIKIIILAFYYPGFKAEYSWFGNTVFSFAGRNKEKIFRLITWIKVWRKLHKINKEYKITGLLSFWATECAVIGKYFGKFYGKKHYTWILGQDAKKDNKYIGFFKPDAHSLIAVSDSVADEFYKNHGIKPKHIIYNGIESGLFLQDPKTRNIDILGAGSLIPLKQYDVFINIVRALKQDFPDIKAVICGGGPEESNLKKQIHKLDLDNNIQLTGTIEHAETLLHMQQAKVFLHTSIYEGFSTACLEALYAGAHVVSFCYPVKKEIKHWHVVKNEDEMRNKVKQILLDENLAHEPVMVQSIEDTAAEMMKLFL